MSMERIERKCPMCESADKRLLKSMQRQGQEFEIVKCRRCGFVYVHSISSETFTANQQPPDRPPVKSRHLQIKRLCDRHLLPRTGTRKRLRVVEIGAGWGGLGHLFARCPDYAYVGFEPSTSRADFCRANGLDVRQELFLGALSIDCADAVIMDNVLEHVLEPVRLFGDALSVLRPGGLVIVIVPNVHDLRQVHPQWRYRHHWQPHCHINYFSSRHLRNVFQRYGVHSRFFGIETVSGRKTMQMLPRMFMDMVGLHAFGLNCYGVKPVPAE